MKSKLRRRRPTELAKKQKFAKLPQKQRKVVKRLSKVEGKWEHRPWRASWPMVQANQRVMNTRIKEQLRKYAKEQNISLEEAIRRAVEVVRKLEVESSKEYGERGKLPLATFVGCEKHDFFTLLSLISQSVKISDIETFDKSIEKFSLDLKREMKSATTTKERKELEERLAELSALKLETMIEKLKDAFEKVKPVGGAVWYFTYYEPHITKVYLRVLRGETIPKRDILPIVHEVGHNLEKISHPRKVIKITEKEKRIAENLWKKLPSLFPQYYKKRVKK